MADTVYTGARFTLDAYGPRAEALTVRGERVVAAGTLAECRDAARAGYREVDLGGGYAVPGLADAHIHLASYARSRYSVDLTGARSLAEAQQIIARYAETLPADRWVTGGGYDANTWDLDRELHARDLDPYSGGRAVALQSHDGHTTWANTAALAAVGIGPDTPDPPGGRIERDADGPTGLLRETAAHPARAKIAEQDEDLAPMMVEAFDELLARGVTSIHDIDGRDTAADYDLLRSEGRLPLRVYQLFSRDGLAAAVEEGRATGDGDAWLRTGPVKLFSDGALGSHTAALHTAYADDGCDRGVAVLDTGELVELGLFAAGAGIGIAVHAIGDAANTTVLDAVAEIRRRGVGPQLRHRIEHAQHITWPDVERFAALGVIASMQPIHCTSDIPLTRRLLGDRPLASYAWADLTAAGARVAFGSDAPVETIDPIAGIAAATTRRDAATGERDRDVTNTVSPLHALRCYTTEAAYASGEEHDKGRLAPGYLADFVVLDADLTDYEVAASGAARPSVTVVGGVVRWDSSDGGPRWSGL